MQKLRKKCWTVGIEKLGDTGTDDEERKPGTEKNVRNKEREIRNGRGSRRGWVRSEGAYRRICAVERKSERERER